MGNLLAIDPRTLPGLFAWYSADILNGFGGAANPADATAVAQWNDLSGNGRHLVQATGANQPIYKVGLIAGNPIVRYVDATDTMQVAVAGAIARPITVIGVFKNSEADDAALNRVATFNAQRIGLALDWATANAFTGVDDNVATATSGVAGDTTLFHVSSFVASPSGTTSRLAVDGVHIFPTGAAGTDTNSNVDVAVAGFIGDVAEVMIFTRDLGPSVLFALEQALVAKYALVTNNAAAAPYQLQK